jgi:hypothetical protein
MAHSHVANAMVPDGRRRWLPLGFRC